MGFKCGGRKHAKRKMAFEGGRAGGGGRNPKKKKIKGKAGKDHVKYFSNTLK